MLPAGQTLLVERLEIHAIVGEQGALPGDGERELFLVSRMEIARIARRQHIKATRPQQASDEHIYIFISVQFDEQPQRL